ncbi:MAG: hypothetical protein SF182_14105 [Deltaproteobacteria bacterium]|nr:hypothetical protein [Deltaproteobacteria bacterium]
MLPRCLPLLLLTALLCLSACGDDGGGGAASPTTTRTASAVPTPTATAVPSSTATAAPSPSPTIQPSPPATATPTASPTATPRLPTSAEVLAPGPYGVGVTTLTLVDRSRATMPNGTYAGTAARVLVTEVWYPAAPLPGAGLAAQRDAALLADGAPYPLVLYSHGYSDTRLSGGPLASHLASHGYLVAAVDFPLSNIGAPGGPTINDVPEQPRDVSFVLDQLLAPQSRFAAVADPDRIALTGLSLGGLTTFLAAYHPDLGDPRVRAAAPVAGLACYFTPAYFAASHLPLLILHGDRDALVPFDANARFAYANANPPKTLVTVHHGSHTGFSAAGAALPGDNPDDFGCAFLLQAFENSPPDIDAVLRRLGGVANGLDIAACEDPCTAPIPLPASVSSPRQLEIANLAVFPFFESVLRDDRAMRRFLDEGLAAENAELAVESQQ